MKQRVSSGSCWPPADFFSLATFAVLGGYLGPLKVDGWPWRALQEGWTLDGKEMEMAHGRVQTYMRGHAISTPPHSRQVGEAKKRDCVVLPNPYLSRVEVGTRTSRGALAAQSFRQLMSFEEEYEPARVIGEPGGKMN